MFCGPILGLGIAGVCIASSVALWAWGDLTNFHVTAKTSSLEPTVETFVECRGRWSADRTCLYRNLYYHKGTFVAFITTGSYLDELSKSGGLAVQMRDKWGSPSHPEVRRFAHERDIRDLVQDAERRGVLERFGGTALFFQRLFTVNIGHILFDTLYPTFVGAVKFERHAANPLTLVMDDESGDCRTGAARHVAYLPDAARSTARSLRPVPVRVLGELNGTKQVAVLPEQGGAGGMNFSVNASWVLDARLRCGEDIMTGFSGRPMRFLDELARDSKEDPMYMVRFDELIMGCGLVGNLIEQPAELSIAGGRPPLSATAKYRDRMLGGFGVLPRDGRRGRRLPRLIVVHNKRFGDEDVKLLRELVANLTKEGIANASYIEWPKVGGFANHMRLVAETDIYVSGPGTALQYAPLLISGSVFVALGSRRMQHGRLFPCFMEQQLVGGGTPYLRALYLDSRAIMSAVDPEKQREAPYLPREAVSELLRKAVRVFSDGFPVPVPVEENLSVEGRIVFELCRIDPATCSLAYFQVNTWMGPGACQPDPWPEQIVYEVDGWSTAGMPSGNEKVNCAVNRTTLRHLRRKYGLPGFGAPEEDVPRDVARAEAKRWWQRKEVSKYVPHGLHDVPPEFHP